VLQVGRPDYQPIWSYFQYPSLFRLAPECSPAVHDEPLGTGFLEEPCNGFGIDYRF